MSEEESKAAIKKVYEQGYHEGFIGACNVITPALQRIIKYLENQPYRITVKRNNYVGDYL